MRIGDDEYRITREKDQDYERYVTVRPTLKEPRADLGENLRQTAKQQSALQKMIKNGIEIKYASLPIDWNSDEVDKKIEQALVQRMKFINEGNVYLFDLELRKIIMPDNVKAIKKKIKEVSVEKSLNAYNL